MKENMDIDGIRKTFGRMRRKMHFQRTYISFLEKELGGAGLDVKDVHSAFMDYYNGSDIRLDLRQVRTVRFDASNGMFDKDIYFLDEEEFDGQVKEVLETNEAAGNRITCWAVV